jgi:predicted  nucleic acid-binding Zn-ribbon protein
MKKNIVSSKTKTSTTKKPLAAKTATPNQGFVISAAKATRIRKDVVNLGLSFNQLLETVTKGKKDMDAAKETINNTSDSMSEMGEMESLRLQMAMDRLSKMMSTLSNLLKKISDTSSAITQNIK